MDANAIANVNKKRVNRTVSFDNELVFICQYWSDDVHEGCLPVKSSIVPKSSLFVDVTS